MNLFVSKTNPCMCYIQEIFQFSILKKFSRRHFNRNNLLKENLKEENIKYFVNYVSYFYM